MSKQPADPVTLSEAEGEALMAHVHQSNVPVAVAERLEQIIRTGLWLVLALQKTQMTVKRLRRLLFGKGLKPLPTPADTSAPASPAASDATHAGAVLAAAGADADATAAAAPPDASPRPERIKPKGGHRLGTGRLGAAASSSCQDSRGRGEPGGSKRDTSSIRLSG